MYCGGFSARLAALAKGSEVALKMTRRKFYLIVKESDSIEEVGHNPVNTESTCTESRPA